MTYKNLIRILEALHKAHYKIYKKTIKSGAPDTQCAYELGRLEQIQKILEMLK